MIDLAEYFEMYEDLSLAFDEIRNPPHTNRHLCAFLLLDKLGVLDDSTILAVTHLNNVELAVDCNKLAKVANKEDIATLIRCGVKYDTDGYLYMFV